MVIAYGYRNVTLNGCSKVVSEDKASAQAMLQIVQEANPTYKFTLVTFKQQIDDRKVWKVGSGRAGNNYCVNVKKTIWVEVK